MRFRSRCITLDDRRYADRLQRRRWDLGLTLREVGAATQTSISTLWHYEHAYNRPSADKRRVLEAYYSGLEADRKAAPSDSTVELPDLNPKAREVIRSIIDRLTALLVEANEICYEPASADAGADQKVRDGE